MEKLYGAKVYKIEISFYPPGPQSPLPLMFSPLFVSLPRHIRLSSSALYQALHKPDNDTIVGIKCSRAGNKRDHRENWEILSK